MSSCLSVPTYSSYSTAIRRDNCEIFQSWGDGTCSQRLENLVNSNPSGMTKFNLENTEKVQLIVEQALFNYLTPDVSGNINDLLNPQSPGLSEIVQTCSSIPYACDRFLTYACNNCSQLDIVESGNTGLTKLCGCYAFKSLRSDPKNICDPTCNNNISIKNQFDLDGDPLTCEQTVCVIDDISIKSQNGDVNVSQVCTGCAGSGCVCYINIPDTDIPNINLESSCSSHVCLDTKKNIIPCPPQVTSIPDSKLEQNYLLIFLTFIVLVLISFVISLTV